MYTPTRKRWRAWPECTPWRSVGTSPRSRRQHSSEAMMHDRFLSHFLIERPNQPDAVLYPKSSTHTLEKCFPGKRIRKSSSDLPTSSRGSHPRLNEGSCIREYSKFRPIEYISFKSFQCLLESSLIVEYSRMQLPSLSRGCEIAQFFVRHTDLGWFGLPKSSFGRVNLFSLISCVTCHTRRSGIFHVELTKSNRCMAGSQNERRSNTTRAI